MNQSLVGPSKSRSSRLLPPEGREFLEANQEPGGSAKQGELYHSDAATYLDRGTRRKSNGSQRHSNGRITAQGDFGMAGQRRCKTPHLIAPGKVRGADALHDHAQRARARAGAHLEGADRPTGKTKLGPPDLMVNRGFPFRGCPVSSDHDGTRCRETELNVLRQTAR
jgi:hypothetical protein